MLQDCQPSKPPAKHKTLDGYFKPASESTTWNLTNLGMQVEKLKLGVPVEEGRQVETPLKTEAQNTKDHSEEKPGKFDAPFWFY